ncbi:YbaB/EbfC family DNA-binding protein [Gordonia sp. CPCC 206044]|uniref:YbaB/EbfC family DNA-binding protein n=1 Tax=Gordonia sp. CPCC 206044 TaxID=3140793 RepID=UPI003AF38DF2
MDELEARARTHLDRLSALAERYAAISVRETSPDERVTAEVDGVGALTGLWLAPGACDDDLGPRIVEVATAAAHLALARRALITAEFTESFAGPSNG